jgi:hypothetical protein
VTYTGRCNCGAVSATFEAEPMWVRQCWCRQCQKIAAGASTVNALFALDAMTLRGELAWNSYGAESGNTTEHGFCPSCGTQVLGRNSARQKANVVRLGFLDEPHGLSPDSAIWLDEAPSWAVIDPTIEQHRRQPPLPAPKRAD